MTSASASRRFNARKRGLSGMNSSEPRNSAEGAACTQNIQRQASCCSHSVPVDAPAAWASR